MVSGDAVPLPVNSDEEPTTPGRRTIVGVYSPARRPWSRLSPAIVEFAEGFFAEPIDRRIMDDLRRRMMAAADRESREVANWLEIACSHVLLLGYRPEDCAIEHHDRPRRVRHVLRVRRMECFEVAVIRHWDGERAVTTVTPRVLGWPPPR